MMRFIFKLMMRNFIRGQVIKTIIFLIGAGTGIAMTRDARKTKNNAINGVRNIVEKAIRPPTLAR